VQAVTHAGEEGLRAPEGSAEAGVVVSPKRRFAFEVAVDATGSPAERLEATNLDGSLGGQGFQETLVGAEPEECTTTGDAAHQGLFAAGQVPAPDSLDGFCDAFETDPTPCKSLDPPSPAVNRLCCSCPTSKTSRPAM